MICETTTLKYCKEDISLIENYDKAISDESQTWHTHHRLETHDENGNLRSEFISKQSLKEDNLYYNRPANELIFLTAKDHISLHTKGKHRTEETLQRMSQTMSKVMKERNTNDEIRMKYEEIARNMGLRNKGRKMSEETKQKLRDYWARKRQEK